MAKKEVMELPESKGEINRTRYKTVWVGLGSKIDIGSQHYCTYVLN